jgi:hypothetical protein
MLVQRTQEDQLEQGPPTKIKELTQLQHHFASITRGLSLTVPSLMKPNTLRATLIKRVLWKKITINLVSLHSITM